ncbi:MAG: Hsp70 family protein [Nitrospirae bacterium]|nr:Hsp70 family protein [Nitrospirota bacterium]
MKAGLDFGTTNSTISYIKEGRQLDTFKYTEMYDYIRSAVLYEDDGPPTIGTAAISQVKASKELFKSLYLYFKMLLPISDSGQWAELANWPSTAKTPREVTIDYLSQLLVEGEHSFKTWSGGFDTIVVSVPEVWQKNPSNVDAQTLEKIIIDDLKLPLKQLISEPVAAATYYVWKEQKTNPGFSGNILLCDVGGGTFDASLCKVEPGKIEVLWYDGNGNRGLGKAGVKFDQEAVRLAWKKKHRTEADISSREFQTLCIEFEEMKINRYDKIVTLYNKMCEDKQTAQEYPLIAFGSGYVITPSLFDEAFKPIQDGISNVLQKAKNYLDTGKIKLDRLAIVGGFGRFFLVKKTILEFFKLNEKDPKCIHLSGMDSHRAIANGAALIASDLMAIKEFYSHSVGLQLCVKTPDTKFVTKNIPIIKAGADISALLSPKFYADETGNEYCVTPSGCDIDTNICVWVNGETLHIHRAHINLPSEVKEKFRVGLRVNRSNLAWLVLESKSGKKFEFGLDRILPEGLLIL